MCIRDSPNKSFFSDAVRAININVLYSLIGVYLIQGIVGQMESLTSFFTYIFSNPGTILLGIIDVYKRQAFHSSEYPFPSNRIYLQALI